jgi:hypothetical protein
MRPLVLLAAAIALVCSCAGVEVRELAKGQAEKPGFTFYRPHPYLLVTRKEGNTEVNVIYLPDRSKGYTIRKRNGFGSVEFNFTLEHGWNLTQFGQTMDPKIPEMMTAATGLVGAAASLLKPAPGSIKPAMVGEEVPPGLYRCEFDSAGTIIGLKEVPVAR